MPTASTINLPPPRDWSEFEDLCRDLWAGIWGDPNTQRHGRSGQGQDGVDIFGRPHGELSVEGIQCKVRNPWLGQRLTEQDVDKAVEDADRFVPPLSRLTIATTSPRDANLQEKVRLLGNSRVRQGKFPVTIFFWEEIQSRLIEHEELLRKHYGSFFLPAKARQGAASIDDLQSYSSYFRQHVAVDLPPLIPTRLTLNDVSVHPSGLKECIVEHGALHLYGPSGTGKSHLAKHLAIELIGEQFIPILIPAKYYAGDFAALLDRSVEHLTTATAESLISGALTAGSTPLLILDGFNECPESLRPDLAKDLKALRLRIPVRIVVTSRPEVPCDSPLPARVYKLDCLSPEERDSLISYYGGLTGSIVDILRTSLDVRIAAESAVRINASSPSQYDLFHAYARRVLSDEFARGFSFLTRCAIRMTDGFTSVLAESEFHRIAQATVGTSAGRLLEVVSDSGLVVFSHGYCSFWHEKIQRFFQAEALLLQHADKVTLAEVLRSPRNEDALEFVFGGLKSIPSIQACLPVVRNEDLLVSLLHGEMGGAAVAAIQAAIHHLLAKAHQELAMIKIEESSSPLSAISIISPVAWEDHEHRQFSFLGRAFIGGFFLEEVLNLIVRSESECLARVGELYPKRRWGYSFPALYVGIGPRSLPVSRIVQAIHGRIRGSWSPGTQQMLSSLFGDLEYLSPGILFLLSTYARDLFWHSTGPNPLAAQLPALLRRMWGTGLRHLRLEASQLAYSAAHGLGEPMRSEVEALLESFLGDNILMNSSVLDALAQYRDLGITSEERVCEEIKDILNGPRDEEAREAAATIFGNQYEEVFGNAYSSAIGALEGKDEVDFHVMAALGRNFGDLFLDATLNRLIELATPEAYPAFEKWSVPPHPEGFITDGLAGVFLLAHIGLARTSELLPAFDLPPDQSEESWRIWGETLFWLHKPGVSEASARDVCTPGWQRLQGPLLLASVDPLFQMEKYARTRSLQGKVYLPVETYFGQELKALYERALPRNSELTSILGPPSLWADDRAIFMIEELGRLGDEGSVLVVEPYVESEVLGRSAVKAIRCIRERLT